MDAHEALLLAWEDHTSLWCQCGPEAGACAFMSWIHGAPEHCGILLPGDRLLHAQSGRHVKQHGSVRVTRLAAIARMHRDIRFYKYAPPPC
jgi:hypothetical protein